MTEADWLASDEPARMLTWLTAREGPSGYYVRHNGGFPASDRKLRLFACACCRHPGVWQQLTDDAPCERCGGMGHPRTDDGPLSVTRCPACGGTGRVNRSRRAVEVASRFADGEATAEELWAANREAIDVCIATDRANPAAHLAHMAAEEELHVGNAVLESAANSGLPPATQAALLRDLFGNPWVVVERLHRPKNAILTFDEGWLTWNDGTVRRIAEGIYQERAWHLMPILADALLDAGCDDESLLRHCRGEGPCPKCLGCRSVDVGVGLARRANQFTVFNCRDFGGCNNTGWRPLRGPHARGCWAVDLILGKE